MKVLKISYATLMCILFAWILFSWLDVIIHNAAPGYEYSNANLIYLYVKGILK
jgi:hypothetical protein